MQEHVFRPNFQRWRGGGSAPSLGRDAVAGISVAFVSFPLVLALGLASGLQPLQGVLAAGVGGIVLAFLGGGRSQIASPTGVLALLSSAVVYRDGLTGLVLVMLLAGVMLVAMSAFKLGHLVRFIPQPIVLGMTAGIAVTLVLGQFNVLMGAHPAPLAADVVTPLATLWATAQTLNPADLAMGGGTLLLAALGLRWFNRWPLTLVVLMVVTALTAWWGLPVATVGSVFGPLSWHGLSLNFSFSYSTFVDFFPSAFALALFIALESYQSATVTEALTGEIYHPDTDFLGHGVANLVLAFLGGPPVSGTVERSVMNVRRGAKSPLAGLIHGVALLILGLAFSPWLKWLPVSSLGAVVILLGLRMVSWKDLALTFKTTRSDALALAVTFLVTLTANPQFALLSGLLVASFFFMRSMAQTSSAQVTADHRLRVAREDLPQGTSVLDLTGAFFFGAATKFEQTFRDILPVTQTLVLRMGELNLLDASGTRVLQRLLTEAREQRIRVIVTEAQPSILRVLEHAQLISQLGPGNLFASFDGVVKELRRSQPLVFSIHPEDSTQDPIT